MIFLAIIFGSLLGAPYIEAFDSKQNFHFDLDTGESVQSENQIKAEGLRFLETVKFDDFFEGVDLKFADSSPQHVRVNAENNPREHNPFSEYILDDRMDDIFDEAESQLHEVPYEEDFFALPSDRYHAHHDRYSASASNQYPDFGDHTDFFNDAHDFYGPSDDNKEQKQGEESHPQPDYDTEDNYGTEPSDKEKKSTEKCVQKSKNGMTCKVCKDDYGGFSEHCSHSRHSGNDKKYSASQRRANDQVRKPETQEKSDPIRQREEQHLPVPLSSSHSPRDSNREATHPQGNSHNDRNSHHQVKPDEQYYKHNSVPFSQKDYSGAHPNDSKDKSTREPNSHRYSAQDNHYQNSPRYGNNPAPKGNNLYLGSGHDKETERSSHPREASRSSSQQTPTNDKTYFPEHINGYQQEGNKHLTYDIHIATPPKGFADRYSQPNYKQGHSGQQQYPAAGHDGKSVPSSIEQNLQNTPKYTIKPQYPPKQYAEQRKRLPSRQSIDAGSKHIHNNPKTADNTPIKTNVSPLPNPHHKHRPHSHSSSTGSDQEHPATEENFSTDYNYDVFPDHSYNPYKFDIPSYFPVKDLRPHDRSHSTNYQRYVRRPTSGDSLSSDSYNLQNKPLNSAGNFKDLSKMVDDFGKKNRKNCKKVMKDSLTCYLCATKEGKLDEDCMYEQVDQNKGIHLMYTEEKTY